MKKVTLNTYYLDKDLKEGFIFNDSNGKYYNDSLGINIKSWNGEVNFDELFNLGTYEDFYEKLVSLLKFINSLSSYNIDFEERVGEEDEEKENINHY